MGAYDIRLYDFFNPSCCHIEMLLCRCFPAQDIVAMILIVVEENLPFGVLWTPWSDLFYACMFWFVFLLVIYCLFFCFMGWYCEIPLISEGVYIQIEQAESMG